MSFGRGGPKDEPGAVKLFERSCDGGFAFAYYALGTMLEEGRGGHELDTWVATMRPQPHAIAAVGAHIARALHAIHLSGTFHGDVTPPTIQVLDGVSAKLGGFDSGLEMREQQGTLIGCLEYMPPEMLRCAAESASDIYQLGGALYVALSGKPLRDDEEREAGGLVAILSRPVTPIREHQSDLAAGWYPLIDAMLDLEASRRPAADEVERRLAELAGNASLALPLRDCSSAPEVPRPPPDVIDKRLDEATELVGSSVRSWTVIRLIGSGSIGVVYELRHHAMDRRAALKVLHPALAEHPRLRERFIAEIHAMRDLRHPNVVEIYDVGELLDGRSFAIFELLDGGSVERSLAAVVLRNARIRGTGDLGRSQALAVQRSVRGRRPHHGAGVRSAAVPRCGADATGPGGRLYGAARPGPAGGAREQRSRGGSGPDEADGKTSPPPAANRPLSGAAECR